MSKANSGPQLQGSVSDVNLGITVLSGDIEDRIETCLRVGIVLNTRHC